MTSIIISTNVLKTTIDLEDIYRKSWAIKNSIDKLIYNTLNLNRWRPGCPEWKVGYDDDVDDYFDDHIPWWHGQLAMVRVISTMITSLTMTMMVMTTTMMTNWPCTKSTKGWRERMQPVSVDLLETQVREQKVFICFFYKMSGKKETVCLTFCIFISDLTNRYYCETRRFF